MRGFIACDYDIRVRPFSSCQHFSVMDYYFLVAAVSSSCQQDNVRKKAFDLFEFFRGYFKRKASDNFSAGAKRREICGFTAVVRHKTNARDAEPPGRAAARESFTFLKISYS